MTVEKRQLPQTTFCSQIETVKLQSQLSISLKHGIVLDNEKSYTKLLLQVIVGKYNAEIPHEIS